MTFALPAYARGRKADAASGDADSVEGELLETNIIVETQDDRVDKNVLGMSAQ